MTTLLRFFLLAGMATGLSSCGTASHFLGQAGGLLQSVAAPVTGILRLSDESEKEKAKPSPSSTPKHDRLQPETKRRH